MPISTALQKMKDHAESVYTWSVSGWAMPEDVDQPDYEADWYKEQLDDIALVRTVFGGTKAMRQAGETYLPQHPAEPDASYERRLKKAVLYNALKRTVGGLVGMVFRKDPILSADVPEVIAEHAENIDLQGRHVGVFAKDLFQDGMIDGHAYIHVEFPEVDGEFRTLGEEKRAGVRPYWTAIKKEDAINARWQIVNGEPRLSLFVYREWATEDVGNFGQVSFLRYRVLKPGSFEVWQKNAKNKFEMVEQGRVALDEIPIVPLYVNRTGIFQSCPPLLDLADENISHYQIRSDRRHALSLTCFPFIFGKGMKEDALKLGPNWALVTENKDADVKYVEPEASSLQEVRVELQDIESRMASLGLQMLVRETRQAETAQAKIIDKSESDSALSASARALGDALENALKIHAEYLKIAEGGGSVLVNDDFRDQEMTPGMIKALSDEVERDHLSLETLWDRLIAGEILPADFDTEAEQAKIDAQAMEKMIEFVEARERGEMGNGGPPIEPPVAE